MRVVVAVLIGLLVCAAKPHTEISCSKAGCFSGTIFEKMAFGGFSARGKVHQIRAIPLSVDYRVASAVEHAWAERGLSHKKQLEAAKRMIKAGKDALQIDVFLMNPMVFVGNVLQPAPADRAKLVLPKKLCDRMEMRIDDRVVGRCKMIKLENADDYAAAIVEMRAPGLDALVASAKSLTIAFTGFEEAPLVVNVELPVAKQMDGAPEEITSLINEARRR